MNAHASAWAYLFISLWLTRASVRINKVLSHALLFYKLFILGLNET